MQGFDTVDLDLPPPQHNLLKAVRSAAANKPLIVVLLNGCVLSVNWTADNADAIVEAYVTYHFHGCNLVT